MQQLKLVDIKTKRFAVIGSGDTGISIIKYLQYCRATISKIMDTRDNPPKLSANLFAIPLFSGKLELDKFHDIDVVVVSPGVSIYEPVLLELKQHGVIVIGDVELFAWAIRDWHCKVIGVTGSNGKTTVTALTGYLAKHLGVKTLVAGNIGVPVLNSYLEAVQANDIPQLVVLELSSFQLETTYSLQLDAATVLNISEDHLDRYRDLLEYAYVKANIFDHCQVQVLNMDDAFVMGMKRDNLSNLCFGVDEKAEFNLTMVQDSEPLLKVFGRDFIGCHQLQLSGWHNYSNVLAALALLNGSGYDIYNKHLVAALLEFAGLEHRMQKVFEHRGIVFIEDSKGTNVGAVVAGVSGLICPVHLILGGDGKGQDFTPLRQLVMAKCKSVAVIGKDKGKILGVLEGLEARVMACNSLEQAIDFCYNNAIIGDSVVLSPACASWDMFRDYKHRAQVFVEHARSYLNL